MKPRISLVTLGVTDLHRSMRFYRDGLGLPTEGIVGEEIADGAVAFFELEGGLLPGSGRPPVGGGLEPAVAATGMNRGIDR